METVLAQALRDLHDHPLLMPPSMRNTMSSGHFTHMTSARPSAARLVIACNVAGALVRPDYINMHSDRPHQKMQAILSAVFGSVRISLHAERASREPQHVLRWHAIWRIRGPIPLRLSVNPL
jgi:hypothetical protein